MKDIGELLARLRALDGRGYKAYKELEGPYRDGPLRFSLDHAQGDPFADPSRVSVELRPADAGFPDWAWRSRDRRRATADYLNRELFRAACRAGRPGGSGRSGEIQVLRPGQAVLDRSSLEVDGDGAVRARFRIGLPARGRRILGRAAAQLVSSSLEAVRSALFYSASDPGALRTHVETVEDAVALRSQLIERGLVAFVANGAILPRRTGVDDRPMAGPGVVLFLAPATLQCTLTAPNSGPVPGMGIPRGVTLIVGGGYHGKSTLLRAVERGVYDHVPGDGRERVVTVAGAAKVRAEDGRRVPGVDISNFIAGLPDGSDTTRFETDNASGSTSQAAAIVEALEAGALLLLLDEDTSATNFMIRDGRMQRLVSSADEPITPFVDRVRMLHAEEGVSTIVVVGGSGDYFDVADQVIAMREYRARDVTADARRVARELPSVRSPAAGAWRPLGSRHPDPSSLDPGHRQRGVSIRVLSRDRVQYGAHRVELGALEQLVETAQARAVAFAVAGAHRAELGGASTLADAVQQVVSRIERDGLVSVHPHGIGELAMFRPLELAGFINRVRGFNTSPATGAAAPVSGAGPGGGASASGSGEKS